MIIVGATRKGGSGKSTILCNLAACFAQSGKSVLLIDCDPQQSSLKWALRRGKNGKLSRVEARADTPSKELAKSYGDLRKKYDHILIDLPGQDSNENRSMIRWADIAIVPFKPTQADLDTLPFVKKNWFETLQGDKEKAPTKFFWIINEASTLTAKDKKDALAFMKAFGVEVAGTALHARATYRDCMALGMGVVEMTNPKASVEFSSLFSELLGIIESNLVSPSNTTKHEVIQ